MQIVSESKSLLTELESYLYHAILWDKIVTIMNYYTNVKLYILIMTVKLPIGPALW